MNTHVPHQRRYIPGTMVLETTWHTPSGWLLVQDLLVVQPVADGTRRADYRRAPAIPPPREPSFGWPHASRATSK